MQSIRTALAALALTAVCLPVWSAPCGGTYPVGEPLSTSDVSLAGAASDACYGIISGNINNNTAANTALGGYAPIGAGWTTSFLSTDGALLTDWLGLRFGLSITGAGTTMGDYTITATDLPGPPDLPTNIDLLVAVKAGNQWAAYFFDEQAIGINPVTGMWSVKFDNDPNPPFANLSHLMVLFRESSTPFCSTPSNCTRTVPEPTPLALLGLLLLAPIFMRRRTR